MPPEGWRSDLPSAAGPGCSRCSPDLVRTARQMLAWPGSQGTRSPRLLSHFLLYCNYFIYASEEMLSLTRPVFHSNLFPEVKRIVSAGVSASNTSLRPLVVSGTSSRRLHKAEGVRTAEGRRRMRSWWVLLAGRGEG